ncbi:MAG: M20/M25/M40 family metallo-hydrolase [Victivallales bacterium]|nr:M20/M25/M40 family metallo-hydrolase [Victivallales bacterium]
MNNRRQTIGDAVRNRRRDILDFLEEMVNTNSYSHNKNGIDKVGDIVRSALPESFQCEVDKQSEYGDNYIYRNSTGTDGRLLLGGHIDTLCLENPDFKSLVDLGDTLVGPGVNDMKGGDTVMIWALRILEEIGLLGDVPITCVFNGDEELGSPSSARLFRAMRDEAKMALIFECGGPEGTVVTTRKGNYRKIMEITGVANHFGNLKERKVSAVEELAHRILQVEKTNRADGSLSANAGKIWGGLARNAVAEKAGMDFEIRFWDAKDAEGFIKEFEKSINTPFVNGCVIELKDMPHRPPMIPSTASMELFDLIVKTGEGLGQRIIEEKRGGFSDGNWLTHVGVPTIDGLGPLGDKDFTTEEYIVKETLFDRVELVVNLIIEISEKWL